MSDAATGSVVLGGTVPPMWDKRPSTSDPAYRRGLSLPDIRTVDRRNAAYGVGWRRQVDHMSKTQEMNKQLADRRVHEQSIAHSRSVRNLTRVSSARHLLGTPLRAGMTPLELEAVATGRREAQTELHAECMRREEAMRRELIAKREETLASDQKEQLTYLQQEAQYRVKTNKLQQADALRFRRALELKRNVTDRERDLAERAAERKQREANKQQRQDELEKKCSANRSRLDKLAKQREEEARRLVKAREAAADEKARRKALVQAYSARLSMSDYAKRLEKTWKASESLAARATDDFQCHVLKFKDVLPEDAGADDGRHSAAEEMSADAEEIAAAALEAQEAFAAVHLADEDEGGGGGASVGGLGSTLGPRSVFFEDWALAEDNRLHAKLELARRRVRAAKATYERVRRESMTPEELQREALSKE